MKLVPYPARMYWPSKASRIERKRSVIPLIFAPNAIPHEGGSDWMRALKIEYRRSDRTIKQFGGTVVMFLNFRSTSLSIVKEHRVDIVHTTESDIRSWRNLIEQGSGPYTANYRVRLIIRFLQYLRKSRKFPIEVFSRKSDPETSDSIHISRLLAPQPGIQYLPVPSTQLLDVVQASISAHTKQHVERDICMFLWAKEAGLRNSEFGQLKKSQLPTLAEISAWRMHNITPSIKITGKGLKTRTVEPPLSLVERTVEFSLISNSNSEYVFVTNKGSPLLQQSISSLFSRHFKIAGSDLTIHRVRAYYLLQVIIAKLREFATVGELDDFSVTTCIAFVLDRAGHESEKTLRYYIRLAAISLSLKYPATLDD